MDKIIGMISANYSTAALGGLTSIRTVASLPFGGCCRMIDFALSSMVHSGITTIGVITPYRHRSLLDHLGTRKSWPLDRKVGGLFLLPGSIYGIRGRGNRFSLQDFAQNKSYLMRSTAEYIAVSSSNIIHNLDYKPVLEYMEDTKADLVMIYQKTERDYPDLQEVIIDDDARITGIEHGTRAGCNTFMDNFIIRKELLLNLIEWYADSEYVDILEIVRSALNRINVRGFAYNGYAGGVSSFADYLRCNQDLLMEPIRRDLFSNERPILTKVHDNPPTRYFENAKVSNSFVNMGCMIHGTIENSVLFRGVQVEEGAVIRNSIIMSHCHIGKDTFLENAILDKYYILKDHVKISGTPENPFVGEKRIL